MSALRSQLRLSSHPTRSDHSGVFGHLHWYLLPALSGNRPHVSLSEAFPSAFASRAYPAPAAMRLAPALSSGSSGYARSLPSFDAPGGSHSSFGFRGGEPGSLSEMPSPEPGPFGREPLLQRSLVRGNDRSDVCSSPTQRCLLGGDASVGVGGDPVCFPLHRVEDQSLPWGRRISLVHSGLGITPNFERDVEVFTSLFLFPFR